MGDIIRSQGEDWVRHSWYMQVQGELNDCKSNLEGAENQVAELTQKNDELLLTLSKAAGEHSTLLMKMALFAKFFEVRDRSTYIPVLAFKPGYLLRLVPADQRRVIEYGLHRCGWPTRDEDLQASSTIIMARLDTSDARSDPYDWKGSRTMIAAHEYIREHWEKLASGTVVCVETILGERATPKTSEALTE